MKRLLLIPAVLVAALFVVLLLGRVPSDYAVQEACRKVHNDRRYRAILLEHELGRLEKKRRDGEAVEADMARVQTELDETLVAVHAADLGGWDAVIMPPGAKKPDSAGWYVWGEFDPSEKTDRISVKGA